MQYAIAKEGLRLRVMWMRASRVRLYGIEKPGKLRQADQVTRRRDQGLQVAGPETGF